MLSFARSLQSTDLGLKLYPVPQAESSSVVIASRDWRRNLMGFTSNLTLDETQPPLQTLGRPPAFRAPEGVRECKYVL